MTLRPGVRLGVDVGRARVGVARCDPHAMLATPVETVPRDDESGADLRRIVELANELEAIEIVVGHPLSMSGQATASTEDAVAFAGRLAAASAAPVRLVDERLSTVSAHSALRSAGKRTKQHRPVVDQVAAVIILQHALDAERAAPNPPGTVVAPNEGR
ncbi:putative pre-16S rRNA nuclease [Agromyces rhizosphaerae]|uniref:Putative pre-16S rRNA nuclease n=1 Tax=Agromyces rhizosphaerae TaxID=88374 RepID=A0A9W6CZE6_9MICO|nr:Holliday junction resolvase RuvX [Agromyces rhizosphaerae]GLI28791.1 putative pre-16S rRNA nuclease [Agromyces rhizosphaerae]